MTLLRPWRLDLPAGRLTCGWKAFPFQWLRRTAHRVPMHRHRTPHRRHRLHARRQHPLPPQHRPRPRRPCSTPPARRLPSPGKPALPGCPATHLSQLLRRRRRRRRGRVSPARETLGGSRMGGRAPSENGRVCRSHPQLPPGFRATARPCFWRQVFRATARPWRPHMHPGAPPLPRSAIHRRLTKPSRTRAPRTQF